MTETNEKQQLEQDLELELEPEEPRRKLFCEISPTTYAISLQKEIVKRHLRNLSDKVRFAKQRSSQKLPNVVSSHSSNMIKKGPGIDPVLQENKAVNIRLCCERMNGLILHPGEAFSFWGLSGKPSARRGFKEGRVINAGNLVSGVGGGLCNLANTIHLLVIHSPLEVIELHHHSDALAPDAHGRVPYSAGTSVAYNNQDFRFQNNTDQDFQLLLWCEGDDLHGELRSVTELPVAYRIVEEGHHFRKEGRKYYRVGQIYRETLDCETGQVLECKLLRDNHSEVMFDYSLIPADQIRS